MKLFSFLLLLTLPFFSFAQSSEMEIMKEKEENLAQKIQVLQDSLYSLRQKIAITEKKPSTNSNKVEEPSEPVNGVVRKGGVLKEKPEVGAKTLMVFDERTYLKVHAYENRHYRVCLEEICGYVYEIFVVKNKGVNAFKEEVVSKLKEQENEEKDEKLAQENLEEEERMIAKYGKGQVERMKEGKIWIGMNEEQAKYSLGNPKDVNRSVGSWGVHEQWIYNGFYVYFENGELTSWQD